MLAFIDTETTGLDPIRHELWEVAYTLRDEEGKGKDEHFQLYCGLNQADPRALSLNRFAERYDESAALKVSRERRRLQLLADLHEVILVGNNVAFDAKFLAAFLGSEPWHYHVVDVKALVGGRLGIEPPWDTAMLLSLAGLPAEKRYEAFDDCRKAEALFDYALGTEGAPVVAHVGRPRAESSV